MKYHGKKWKRIASIALVIIMVCTLGTVALATPGPVTLSINNVKYYPPGNDVDIELNDITDINNAFVVMRKGNETTVWTSPALTQPEQTSAFITAFNAVAADNMSIDTTKPFSFFSTGVKNGMEVTTNEGKLTVNFSHHSDWSQIAYGNFSLIYTYTYQVKYAYYTSTDGNPNVHDGDGAPAEYGPVAAAPSITDILNGAPATSSFNSNEYSKGDVSYTGTLAGDDLVFTVNYYRSVQTPPPPSPPPTGTGNYLTVTKAVPGDLGANEEFLITVTFRHTVAHADLSTITSPGLNGDYTPGQLGIPFVQERRTPVMTFTFPLSKTDGTIIFSNIPLGTTYTVSESITSEQEDAGWAGAGITYDDPDRKIELVLFDHDDDHVTVNNTYTPPTPQGYPVTYNYVAASGALPSGISTTDGAYKVSDPSTYPAGTLVDLVDDAPPVGTVFETTDGRWTLTSWSTHPLYMTSDGITFTGTWTFEAKQIQENGVTYNYVAASGTLPSGISTTDGAYKVSDPSTYPAGALVDLVDDAPPVGTVFETTDGRWTLTSWSTHPLYMTSDGITFTGTWTFEAKQIQENGVTYNYVAASGTLPSGISTTDGAYKVSDPNTYPAGTLVDLVDDAPPVGTVFETTDGRWTLTSWSTHPLYMTSDGITFTGTWTFRENDQPTPDYATLTVTKQVSGSNTTEPFTIEVAFLYEGDNGLDLMTSGTGTVSEHQDNTYILSLRNGEYIKFSYIPYGTSYTVQETTPLSAGWTKSGESSGSFYNEDEENINSSDTVTILNTYTSNTPDNTPLSADGTLTVTKTISGDVDVAPDDTFNFTVTFTPGAPSYRSILGINAPASATGSNGVFTFSLKAGQSITFTNIPVDTIYTVVETSELPDGWTAGTQTASSGSINANGVTATFDNVYDATGVLGDKSSEEDPDEDAAVMGDSDSDVLPQTGGVSAVTLAGIAGLILLGSGLVMFLNNRKKREE